MILITKPTIAGGWFSNIVLAIPRVVCGFLLSFDFGSSKFGMPWTDSEKGLGLFEVASWFPEDVAKFGVPFSLMPWLFAWLAAASEAIGGLFLLRGFRQGSLHS
jgi:putative oxidoreductase